MAKSRSIGICDLPENCISHILSLTTPRDAWRSAAVCSVVRSAANSDYVWENLLPADYEEILSRSVFPVEFTSKKQLYFRLCCSILIDSGRKSFSIESSTGRKCFALSARELMIKCGDDKRYWKWIFLPQARFREVAELCQVRWLEIRGKFDVRSLSPRTWYVASLVIKVLEAFGFDSLPVELSVTFKDHVASKIFHLSLEGELEDVMPVNHFLRWADEWKDLQIGEFFTGDGDGQVEMSVMEVKRGNWKGGIAIEGIKIRPRI